jgi:hypothetical protein
MVLRRILDILALEALPLGAGLRTSVAWPQQLHELYAFQVHVHERRDVFVAALTRVFIGRMGTKRCLLEREFKTRILSRDEFAYYCEIRRSSLLSAATSGG